MTRNENIISAVIVTVFTLVGLATFLHWLYPILVSSPLLNW